MGPVAGSPGAGIRASLGEGLLRAFYDLAAQGSARPRVGIGTSVSTTLFLNFGVWVMNRNTVRKRPPMGRSGAARRCYAP
ncbi:hypothetical protein DSM107133_03955 (plasmid) [Pseudosulfitobacter sp. DSM 107133]|nr:hypothetical protein DSM107133_03955 [Pseudosulfitobacter sp. DSM 107133]